MYETRDITSCRFKKLCALIIVWRRQLSSTLESWLRFMRYFLVYTKKDVFMIFYENLKTELREEMVRVNEFIGPPLDQRRLNCLLDEQEQTNQQRFLKKVGNYYLHSACRYAIIIIYRYMYM